MSLKKDCFLFGLLVFLAILISGCVQPDQTGQTGTIDGQQNESSSTPQLGDLCSGEEECKEFCLTNSGRCEGYCRGNYENELCLVIFPPGEEGLTEVETPEEANVENKKCGGNRTRFDFAPVNLGETKVFLPLGLMTGSHVTPIDHHYFQNFDNEGYDIEVYSPGRGFITEIQHMPGAKNGEDYRVVIEHTCAISSVFIHLGNFAEKFKGHAPDNNRYFSTRIPVEAGELIGYYEKNIDYNLVDTEVTLAGFVNPESYWAEPWKIHVPDTYEYFNEPVRSRLVEKSLRTASPISGKIDYDIDGRLVGNWFLEGTNGYLGADRQRYWTGHLAIVYDAYGPDRVVFSIGNYSGEDSRQFGVKGNAPDPAAIGIESGLVKYELVEYDWFTPDGSSWDRRSVVNGLVAKSNEMVQGVVLAQMIGSRKMKFEAFPGKAASEVTGFTPSAKVYER